MSSSMIASFQDLSDYLSMRSCRLPLYEDTVQRLVKFDELITHFQVSMMWLSYAPNFEVAFISFERDYATSMFTCPVYA